MRTTLVRLGLVLGLAASASACGNDVFSPSEEEARAAAQAKWLARPFASYRMEIRLDCQCQEVVLGWNTVVVQNGLITSVTPVGGTTPVDSELHDLWITIEGIFVKLKGPHPDNNVIDIRAQYDPDLGYPVQADFIYSGLFSDATVSYFLRNVGPLN